MDQALLGLGHVEVRAQVVRHLEVDERAQQRVARGRVGGRAALLRVDDHRRLLVDHVVRLLDEGADEGLLEGEALAHVLAQLAEDRAVAAADRGHRRREVGLPARDLGREVEAPLRVDALHVGLGGPRPQGVVDLPEAHVAAQVMRHQLAEIGATQLDRRVRLGSASGERRQRRKCDRNQDDRYDALPAPGGHRSHRGYQSRPPAAAGAAESIPSARSCRRSCAGASSKPARSRPPRKRRRAPRRASSSGVTSRR